MPTVTVRRTIDAPPEQVWTAIADIENAGRWNQAWQRIEFLGEAREGVGTAFRAVAEDGRAAEFEVVAWEPPHYIAFAPRQDLSGRGRYDLTIQSHAFYIYPVGEDRAELELTATAATRGLRGWLLGRFLWPGYQKQGLRRTLEAITALFETEEQEAEG